MLLLVADRIAYGEAEAGRAAQLSVMFLECKWRDGPKEHRYFVCGCVSGVHPTKRVAIVGLHSDRFTISRVNQW